MTQRAERERRYGLDAGDYNWLSSAGRGVCWICQQPESVANRRLAIDHDHVTGAVRGLLCTRCNQVIGRMGDSPLLLRRAADYLEKALDAFADTCRACRDVDLERASIAHRPSVIVETDGQWTRFGYVCSSGHRWACGHRTRGLPWSWSI